MLSNHQIVTMVWRNNVREALVGVAENLFTSNVDRHIEVLRQASNDFDSVFGPCPELYTPEDDQMVVRLRTAIENHRYVQCIFRRHPTLAKRLDDMFLGGV